MCSSPEDKSAVRERINIVRMRRTPNGSVKNSGVRGVGGSESELTPLPLPLPLPLPEPEPPEPRFAPEDMLGSPAYSSGVYDRVIGGSARLCLLLARRMNGRDEIRSARVCPDFELICEQRSSACGEYTRYAQVATHICAQQSSYIHVENAYMDLIGAYTPREVCRALERLLTELPPLAALPRRSNTLAGTINSSSSSSINDIGEAVSSRLMGGTGASRGYLYGLGHRTGSSSSSPNSSPSPYATGSTGTCAVPPRVSSVVVDTFRA